MHAVMDILAQLFWGVTVGALTATFALIAKLALGACAVVGAGWWFWWLRARGR